MHGEDAVGDSVSDQTLAPESPALTFPSMRLRELTLRFKDELDVYQRVWRDPRTPRSARWLLGCAIGYLAMPFDLVPDFIPILGQLDDVLIVPLLVHLAVRRIPPKLVAEHRSAVAADRARSNS